MTQASAQGQTLFLPAYAKINLVLDLLGPRPDGFTEIATIFQTIALHDDLELRLAPRGEGINLVVDGEPPCPSEENLAFRAAQRFFETFPTHGRLEIGLRKRIPAGAGLGGGSSDAAAVLKGLARLSGISLSDPRLERIGSALGADVPYFFSGGLVLGTGRGDQLEDLPDLPSWPLVLARWGSPLGTAEVYRLARAGLTARSDAPNISRFRWHLQESPGALPPLGNDLLPAAGQLEPRILDLLEWMRGHGAQAEMTGSGSTVFGLFCDETSARTAALDLERLEPDGFVTVTRTLPRTEL